MLKNVETISFFAPQEAKIAFMNFMDGKPDKEDMAIIRGFYEGISVAEKIPVAQFLNSISSYINQAAKEKGEAYATGVACAARAINITEKEGDNK